MPVLTIIFLSIEALGRVFRYRLRGKTNRASTEKEISDQDFSNSMVCFSSAIDTHESCRGAPAKDL